MKQIFRFAIVFAVAGAALLSTGCVKDTTGDLATVKKDLAALQSQVVSGLADQTAALEKAKKELQDADVALQANIEQVQKNLDAAKKDLAAADQTNANNIAALEKRVAALEKADTELQKQITSNKETIDLLAKTVADNYDALDKKIGVNADAIIVNKKAIEVLETNLGTLSKRVDKIKEDLEAADAEIIKAYQNADSGIVAAYEAADKKISDDLANVKETADQAAADVAKALGEIESIWKNFNNYYTAAKVDTISSDLAANIKKVSDALNEEIAARIKGDNDVVEKLEKEIKKIQESGITPALEALTKKVDAIAARVTSISVCPTKTDEIKNFKIQPWFAQKLIRAVFEVEPVATAKTIKAKDVELTIACARSREMTKADGDVNYVKTLVDSVYCDDSGRLVVIATGVPKAESGEVHFFALTINGKDAQGNYSVTSDYAQASENTKEIVLTDYIMFALNGEAKNVETLTVADTKKYSYVEAKDSTHTPFAPAISVVYNNSDSYGGFLPTGTVPIMDFCYYLGYRNVGVSSIYNFKPISETPDYPVCVKESGKNTLAEVVEFKPETGKELYNYVDDKVHYTGLKLHLGPLKSGRDLDRYIKQGYQLTKIQQDTVQLPSVRLYWNYKNYKTSERKVVLDASKDSTFIDFSGISHEYKAKVWNDAVAKGATVKQAFTPIDPTVKYFVYSNKDQGYQPLTVSLDEAEFEKIVSDKWDVKTTTASMTKETNSDEYTFEVETTVDCPLLFVKEAVDTVKLDGSISKAMLVPVNAIDSLYIYKDGAIRSKLINGLSGDDVKFANIKAAFDEQINNSNYEVVLSGSTEKEAKVAYDKTSGKMTVTLPAGKTNYNGKYSVLVTFKSVFGRAYTINVPFKTGAPKFSLVTRPYIVGGKGTVRGAVKDGKYTLDSLDYNKQVEIKDLSLANEESSAVYTVKFAAKKDTGASGVPNVTNDLIPVDSSTGALAAYKPMTWGTYNGLVLDMSTLIWINGIPVNVATTDYKLVTDKPIEFVNKGKISKQKKSATPLPINVWQNLEVYGMVDGSIVKTNIMINGKNVAPAIIYGTGVEGNGGKTEYVYADTKDFKFVLNGQSCTLFDTIDYDWDSDKGLFTVKSDNLKGVLTITIPVTVQYYLDYNHTKAEKTSVVIEVSQN